jgi:hypothetical protein
VLSNSVPQSTSSASYPGPPPTNAAYPGPPPSNASYPGPPPSNASYPGPPPATATHPGPPPTNAQPPSRPTQAGTAAPPMSYAAAAHVPAHGAGGDDLQSIPLDGPPTDGQGDSVVAM